ncbi:MAG: response regulator transcription factor [Sphingobium sp.]|jgi:two-component system OmpR family response regulator
MSRKILIMEDDAATADYVARGLGEAGYVTDRTGDGREGFFLASEGSYDLLVVDRMMPGMDGLSVIRALRAADIGTPSIILSALGSVEDRIDGLRGGSDDYVTKPFSLAELMVRAEALLRRADRNAAAASEARLVIGDLEIDLLSRAVRRGGRPIALVPREFSLLVFLARHAGHVVTRTMMLEKLWGYHFDPGTNVIDVHIGRLRRKIDEGSDHSLLHTVRGAGYRLSPEP